MRPGDHKAPVRQPARRLDQQALQCRLPVLRIGAEIAEIPSDRLLLRPVARGIDRTIQGTGPASAEALCQMPQQWAAGEREIQVEQGNLFSREIGTPVFLQRGHGDGRVDVVERPHATGEAIYHAERRDTVGHIGADHDRIRRSDACAEAGL